MRKFSFFLIAAIVFGSNLALATTDQNDKPLLRPAASTEIPLSIERRVGSTFFAMDAHTFEGLATWKNFICTLENIEIPGVGTYTLRLEQFDAVDGSTIGKYPVPKHVFLRGSVDGVASSHVCLTFYYDCAWGYVNIGDRSYALSAAGRSEAGDLIVGITEDTKQAPAMDCGTKEWNHDFTAQLAEEAAMEKGPLDVQAAGSGKMSPLATTLRQIKVGLEIDYPFVQKCGGVDSTAFKYGLTVIAASSDIYMRDAQLALVVSEHFEWTTTDNYTSTTACDVLNEFDGSNMTGPAPGVFVCMSGRPTDWCGGVAANINVLCNKPDNKCILGMKHNFPVSGWGQGAYPYTYWTWDAMVASHEMGHVIACAHTHNCYAYSGGAIDSCFTAEGSCFDTIIPRKGTIMSYCHTSPDPKYTPAGAVLVFHPKCITKLVNAGKKSCASSKTLPSIAMSPSRTVQTCQPRSKITITAGGGTAPYTFEVSYFNPATDSVHVNGNICEYWIKPTRPLYYFRVTTADTVRAYDSVSFQSGTLSASLTQDPELSTKDSVVIKASMTSDTTGATVVWYMVGDALHAIPTPSQWQITVARPAAGQTVKYRTKVTLGSCTAMDTIAVTNSISQEDVAAEIGEAPMRLYPNPAHDHLSLLLPQMAERVWIADALGRELIVPQTHAMMQVGNHMGEQIDFAIAQLAPGAYWIVREVNGRTQPVAFQKN